jgi:hypothetical protein
VPTVLFVLADKALTSTIIVILVWVIAFPVLVQGLIVYAVLQARGEKRANEELRRSREA